MALSQQDRSAKMTAKREAWGKEELRFRVCHGEKNMIAELME